MQKTLTERKPVKNKKDSFITLRVSTAEKERYVKEADGVGMGLSEYVLYLLRHGKIHTIEGGTEIAQAMYSLNDTLNKCVLYPHIPVQRINASIAKDLTRMNDFLNNDRMS